ncbi:hypothetical protein [Streptomyces sp. BPTC-684]|uniref:hypothetical protein n=1 Tax=Streptomyces sp. BPTC-684 TaxID=3043734 RepID=UPI0024B1606A|nr:hypothetical protein [Streptomyces sp. BPTC-684]WHM40379.1 hypothetical protein QIY60_28315 [Streptomyces sp. BPTC-684]
MRTALLRNGARAAAAALAFAAALGGATADATARGEYGDRGRRPVEVSIGASGIHAPHTAQAGLVAFHVRTDDKNGHFLQAFRPHRGVTVRKVLADLRKAVDRNSPATAARGISAVRDEADALGGAQVTPSVSETFTTPIGPGRVVLLDFTAFLADPAHPVTRTLDLRRSRRGGSSKNLAAFPDSIVITRDTAAGPRFDVDGLRRATDNVLVRNASDELHEMGLQPVKRGTTDAQIQAFFGGTASGPPPFTGPSLGLGAISPGRTALLETHHLPRGTYALLCFVPDDKTGRPHVAEGMHKVVVLT